VHGHELLGFEALAKEQNARLIKIEVPSWEIRQIRRSLEACGIDEVSIFPDMEALGRAVTLNWKTVSEELPHAGVYTRLATSTVHGIGVFAIRKITKGTKLFGPDDEGMIWIDKRETGKLSRAIRKLYSDFGVLKGNRYGCPPSFNRLTPAWYINHSDTSPNVKCDDKYEFFAARDISIGEELTVDYSKYSENEAKH
jgi:hypothetical protein